MERKVRGRPRAYDPEQALAGAMDAFWTNGFAGTSLDAIVQATGMNRPSLYAAFGDKEEIYLKALRLFEDKLADEVAAVLKAESDAAAALTSYLLHAIRLYTADKRQPRGCFAICTAATEAAANPKIRAALLAIIERIDRSIEKRLREAQAAGVLPKTRDPAAIASLFGAVLHGLAVRARAGVPRGRLERLARSAVQELLPGPSV